MCLQTCPWYDESNNWMLPPPPWKKKQNQWIANLKAIYTLPVLAEVKKRGRLRDEANSFAWSTSTSNSFVWSTDKMKKNL